MNSRRKEQDIYTIFFNGKSICVVGAKDGVDALGTYFQMIGEKNPKTLAVSMKLQNHAIVQAVKTG